MTLPKLEVLTAGPDDPAAGAPLVFLHGAFCGAWIWAEHFLPYFAGKGRRAVAFSLRGHGASDGHDMLPLASLDDYLDDLGRVLADLGRPPVLIGHSMGGMVVQRHVERLDRKRFTDPDAPPPVAGMALMAALSPGGLAATATQLMLFDPLVLMQLTALQTFGDKAVLPEGVHRAMFARSAPIGLTEKYMPRMQSESRRVQVDLMMGAPPWPGNALRIPRLVLGAEEDPFVPPWMARMTARHYGTEARILPDTGHAMMLGPDWEIPAGLLLDWLTENGI